VWRVSVAGQSMAPALREGDRLLVLPPRGRPRVGEVIVLRDPRDARGLLLKRVAAVRDHDLTVMGDRRDHSTESRYFGDVPLTDVIGRAAFRYAPLARLGRIGS